MKAIGSSVSRRLCDCAASSIVHALIGPFICLVSGFNNFIVLHPTCIPCRALHPYVVTSQEHNNQHPASVVTWNRVRPVKAERNIRHAKIQVCTRPADVHSRKALTWSLCALLICRISSDVMPAVLYYLSSLYDHQRPFRSTNASWPKLRSPALLLLWE